MTRIIEANSLKRHKPAESPSPFQFVNAIPSSADEVAKTRSLVRANATKYQWRTSKPSANRKGPSKYSDPLKTGPQRRRREEKLVIRQQNSPEGGSSDSSDDTIDLDDVSRLDTTSTTSSTTSSPSSSSAAKALPWERRRISAFLSKFASELSSNSQDQDLEFDPGSPISMLGAGKRDPFPSYYPSPLPAASVARYVDYAKEIINPSLLPHAADVEDPITKKWLPQAMASRALFHANIFGTATSDKAIRGALDKTRPEEIQLTYIEAIHALNEDLKDPERACADETIIAVLILASIGIDDWKVEPEKSPCQGPLKGLHLLNIFGRYKSVPIHAQGLAKLIEMRGGLHKIKMEGLAPIISFGAIISATQTLTKPSCEYMPLLNDGTNTGNKVGVLVRDDGIHSLWNLGTGFQRLPQTPPSYGFDDLLSIFQHLCEYTKIIDDYSNGRRFRVEYSALIDQRNVLQWHLVSLPAASECQPDPRYIEPFYEACRFAAMIYSLLVTFPIPTATAPFDRLAMLLKAELCTEQLQLNWDRNPELLLWLLFMGGIAAMNVPERLWYICTLRHLLRDMDVSAWDDVKHVLGCFLWHPSTSDGDGVSLWSEALF